ncbi:MAG: aminotransferase class I/II-fold pyridoxal phosphate-dependent enzyme [Fimbriimonadaceae bacterium]
MFRFLRIEDNFALPPISRFEKVVTDRTKAILICNPNNPTGTIYSEEQLESLRELALSKNITLIADEVYREFVYSGSRPKSVLELEGLKITRS